VPAVVAVSAVSLIGGASLGPEKALGSIGGGAGTWIVNSRISWRTLVALNGSHVERRYGA